MIAFKNRLKETIYERLKAVYPVTREDLDMAPTPDPKMGDLALTFPFQLAKTLKMAPRAIAQEAAGLLGAMDGVD
jgi:arginyl-tRNA synthetase